MQVTIRILPWFSGILIPGRQAPLVLEEELAAGASLRTLLTLLAGRYAGFAEAVFDPAQGTWQPAVVITVNGRLVSPEEALSRTLDARDAIALIPAYSGG